VVEATPERDGGWGEDCLSYWTRAKQAKEQHSISDGVGCAWLLAGEDEISTAVFRGIQYLLTDKLPLVRGPSIFFTGQVSLAIFICTYYGYANYFR